MQKNISKAYRTGVVRTSGMFTIPCPIKIDASQGRMTYVDVWRESTRTTVQNEEYVGNNACYNYTGPDKNWNNIISAG